MVRPRGRRPARTPQPTTIRQTTTRPSCRATTTVRPTTTPTGHMVEHRLGTMYSILRQRRGAPQWLARVKPIGPHLLLERPSIIRPTRVCRTTPTFLVIGADTHPGEAEVDPRVAHQGRLTHVALKNLQHKDNCQAVQCQNIGVPYFILS